MIELKTEKEATCEGSDNVDSEVQAVHHALGLPEWDNRGAVNAATSIAYNESSTGIDISPEDTTRNNGMYGILFIGSTSYLHAERIIRTRKEMSL